MTCSELTSTDAAIFKSSSSLHSPVFTMSVTPNSPFVRVPVLSNTIAWISLESSSASAFFTSIPFFAPRVVAMEVTVGMARPSAWGQAITRTVIEIVTAKSVVAPAMPFQYTKAEAPTMIAVSVR